MRLNCTTTTTLHWNAFEFHHHTPISQTFALLPPSTTCAFSSRNFPAYPTKRMLRNSLARASSLTGSGAHDYSEQLLGAERKKKGKSVAGIDQDDLLDPEMLADPDSCFCEFNGVQIHHKICQEEELDDNSTQHEASYPSTLITKVGFPMILLHGFAASVFSWDKVLKPLAKMVGAKVLSFDRPAFGLTSRVNSLVQSTSGSDNTTPLNPYSTAFSVLATLSFIDLLAAEKAILVGHSAGCLVAVNAYFEASERIAALILVAPAILAPKASRKRTEEDQMMKGKQTSKEDSDRSIIDQENSFTRIWMTLLKCFIYIAQAMRQMVKRMINMVSSLYKKALSTFLRSTFAIILVRMIINKFGIPAIRNAWYDSNQIGDNVLLGYTKPLRIKDWDKALLEYTLAILTDSTPESKPPPSKRLTEISCPVLIITGDHDRLVPSWNSERLSQAIPNSTFKLIKNCGHVPQEERVEEFLSAVEKFLWDVFGSKEQPSHSMV